MECCRQATEAHYLAWLREVKGTDHALIVDDRPELTHSDHSILTHP